MAVLSQRLARSVVESFASIRVLRSLSPKCAITPTAEHAVHLPQIFFNELPGLSEDSVVDVMPMLESGLRGAEILRLTLSPFQGTRGFDNIDLKDAVLLSQIRHTLAEVKCLKIGQIVEVIHRGASKHFVVQDFDLHQDRRDGQIGLFSTNSTFLLAKADVQSKVSKVRVPAADGHHTYAQTMLSA